jgi:hypothetical protein
MDKSHLMEFARTAANLELEEQQQEVVYMIYTSFLQEARNLDNEDVSLIQPVTVFKP